jgi:hypothetical protein
MLTAATRASPHSYRNPVRVNVIWTKDDNEYNPPPAQPARGYRSVTTHGQAIAPCPWRSTRSAA